MKAREEKLNHLRQRLWPNSEKLADTDDTVEDEQQSVLQKVKIPGP